MLESDYTESPASPAVSINRKSTTASSTPLLTPQLKKNRIFNKRQRSPSSSPCPSPLIARKGYRTPSASSVNASACCVDEDETNSPCFCSFPIHCMNFLEDAAKAIRRTVGKEENPCGDQQRILGQEDHCKEQQRLGRATAKLSLAHASDGEISLKSRKENLPPNVVQLLTTSECELLSASENDSSKTKAEAIGDAVGVEQVDVGQVRASPRQLIPEQPLFRASRFSNIAPTVCFVGSNENRIAKPKKSVRRMLKWCYNSLVPKVVRKVLYSSHFQIVSEDSYWVGYWGRHLRTQEFRNVLPYQKVNHFPGTFHLGRKDRLWMNIRRMMTKWQNGDFSAIMPRTFVLPRDAKALKMLMKRAGQRLPIILKPPASARGTGIRVVHRWAQIPRKEPMIAQIYIDQPLLISGSKFDLRLYVYVTSFNPLRIYLYEDGLVRFASIKYSNNLATLGNRLMHLTNYSLNKKANIEGDDRSVTGQKWSVKQLWQYFADQGHDVGRLMERIVDLILKAFISCESSVNTFIRRHLAYPFACHELFGVDIVLDEDLSPWLLEINISPSLHTSTELDVDVKSGLAKDVLNLAGVQLPDRQQVHNASPRLPLEITQQGVLNCLDLRTKQNDNFNLTDEEKKKQAYFTKKYVESGKNDASILDHLTPADVRVLTDTEDEYDRRGHFARIFPSMLSSQYLKYFEKPKYYNLLLDEWIGQYSHIRETGCALLESFCSKGYHLS